MIAELVIGFCLTTTTVAAAVEAACMRGRIQNVEAALPVGLRLSGGSEERRGCRRKEEEEQGGEGE